MSGCFATCANDYSKSLSSHVPGTICCCYPDVLSSTVYHRCWKGWYSQLCWVDCYEYGWQDYCVFRHPSVCRGDQLFTRTTTTDLDGPSALAKELNRCARRSNEFYRFRHWRQDPGNYSWRVQWFFIADRSVRILHKIRFLTFVQVAHRLKTVIDYNRLLVLDKGWSFIRVKSHSS